MHDQQRPAVLEIYVFALKSGRSMFIRTPDDQRILIDGGGNSQVIAQLTDIIPFYSRRIDAVIVTNTDGKNVSGLVDVMARYDVGRVYVPRYTLENLDLASSTDQIYETFVDAVKFVGVRVDEVQSGDQIPLSGPLGDGEGHRATMHVLFPSQPESFPYSKASAPELLFCIEYGDTSVTFMGDASVKIQKYIASSSNIRKERFGMNSHSNVLVLSHSATEGNVSQELMEVLRPDFLVYDKLVRENATQKSQQKSASKNVKPKSNPLATILNEDRFNLKELGTVRIISDGEGMIIGPSGE